MIEPFDRTNKNHIAAMRKLPFAFMSSEFALSHSAHVIERNGEYIPVSQDLISPHEFPALYLPHKKKNWEYLAVTFATEKDVETLKKSGNRIVVENPISTEFFYSTDQFVNPTGSFRKKINSFKNKHNFEVTNECDEAEVRKFYKFWKTQIKEKTLTFDESESFFFFGLENLKAFGIKQVCVKIDGKLAGLAWGLDHWSGNWVGMSLKVNRKYRDLSRFLHHERAKLFADRPTFTLGTDAFKKGIRQYKQELKPIEERKYTYILTGEKEK